MNSHVFSIRKFDLLFLLALLGVFSYSQDTAQYFFRFLVNLGIVAWFVIEVLKSNSFVYRKNLLVISIVACAFLVLGLVSAHTSVIKVKAFFKVYELFCLFLICFFLVKKTGKEYLHFFCRALWIIIFLSVGTQFFVGDQNIFELHGFFPLINANTIGFIAGLLCLIYVGQRRLYMAAVASILLFLSGSLTSTLLVPPLIILMMARLRTTVVTAFLGLGAITAGGTYLLRFSEFQTLLELSGRTLLWERAFDAHSGLYSVFVGVGLGAGREINAEYYGNVAKSFHNAYIEALVSTGWLGFFLFVVMLLLVASRIIRNVQDLRRVEVALLFYVLLRAFSSSNLVFVSVDTLVLWLVLFGSYYTGGGRYTLPMEWSSGAVFRRRPRSDAASY